ncbi:c-type cytochrome [Aerolutibacter ruishenii]|uniref:Cytochrome c n=1 Tax=Aerolutibacter ruishenii TaxID=686800 RepID=A0A562LV70_9GAMM|nr:c-type cytochrome [Lysobacter ruishenii]TWI11541.1 cytochrome c [Lysobacter ruishenii]
MNRHHRARWPAMQRPGLWTSLGLAVAALAYVGLQAGGDALAAESHHANSAVPTPAQLAEGQRIFRFDTFGDEQKWTDQLRLHQVVEAAVDPLTALAVGLKVDADALPPGILGSVDLSDPATTVALLRLNAVVGLQATVDANNHITRLGVTCALCHSTVDDSVAPGIGRRLDGWANRDLDVGTIIALSPELTDAQRAVFRSWGPGKYDPRYNIDGLNTPLALPPIYGLAHVTNETYTADGPISYWNAYVAVTQMGGQGNFVDPRLGIAVHHDPDLVTPKLAPLLVYQKSLQAPKPAPGSYDAMAANRGRTVFARNCMGCHMGVSGTDNDRGVLHAPGETGMDGAYAARTVTGAYRTTPLRGLQYHAPYFHDGSAATLADVVRHYDSVRGLGLDARQQADLTEFLKTL